MKLHIYDVSRDPLVRHLNQLLAHQGAPVKLGGIFHAAIEIKKLEWSFGSQAPDDFEICASGVKTSLPTRNPQHTFRQTAAHSAWRVQTAVLSGVTL